MIATHPYPDKQPFPRIVAVSLEGKSVADLVAIAEHLPTLPLDAFQQANDVLKGYLSDYQSDPLAKGVAIGVRGPHGSGKTHLIRYLIQSLPRAVTLADTASSDDASSTAQDNSSAPAPVTATVADTTASHDLSARVQDTSFEPPPPVVVYVKVATISDFVALHRQIIAQIGQDRLREVFVRWISRQARDEARTAPLTHGAADTLARNPNAVFDYLNSGLVSSRAVSAATVDSVRGMRSYEDLLRVASFFNRPGLRGEAYAWFMGLPQSEGVLNRLGVNHSLDAESIREALQFVFGMFARAEQPLVLFIDQIERLIRHPSAETRADNIGGLYSLAEWAAEEHAFLCLAGVIGAWENLPPDFFGRLHRQFSLSRLSPDDCLNLVQVYLHPTEPQFTAYRSDDPDQIFPFDEAAVRRVADITQGNPRRFLRLAFRSFELAAPTEARITSDAVDVAYASVEEDFDRSSVLAETENLIHAAGLTYVASPTLPDNLHADLAVLGPSGYVAFIDVSDAIFAQDEAQRAKDYVESAPKLKTANPGAQYILIIAGYSSAQVQDVLRQAVNVVNHSITYTPETFGNRFRGVLNALTSTPSASATNGSPGTPKQTDGNTPQLGELVDQLVQLVADRSMESQARQSQLREYTQAQQIQDSSRLLDEVRMLRENLKSQEDLRVAAAEGRKALTEKQDNERQVARAESERRARLTRSLLIQVGLPAAAGILALLTALLTSWSYNWGLGEIGLVAGAAVAAYGLSRLWKHAWGEPELVRSARRAESDLDALDKAALRLRRETKLNPWDLLRDLNPMVRYLGARALVYRPEPDVPDVFVDLVEKALDSEVNLYVYRTLLEALAESPDAAAHLPTKELLHKLLRNATDAEALCLIDDLDRISGELSGDDTRAFVKRGAAVAAHAVVRIPVDESPLRAWFAEHESGQEAVGVDFALQLSTLRAAIPSADMLPLERSAQDGARIAGLFRSYQPGIPTNLADQIRATSLSTVRPQVVQRLIELYGLSDESSLGYYPHLRGSELYREIYEFLVEFQLALAEVQHLLRAGTGSLPIP